MRRRFISKMPYIGNVVASVYLVKNTLRPSLMKKMPCKTFRLFFPYENCFGSFDGLVVNNSELHEAHVRYAKYAEQICDAMKVIPTGKFIQKWQIPTGRGPLSVNIIFLVTDGERLGYMFTDTNMMEITNRTKEIRATIRRPNFFQRAILWLNGFR